MAIALQPTLVRYLRQGLNDNESLQESKARLAAVFNPAAGG
jgi:flagellum-specific ATP synthase